VIPVELAPDVVTSLRQMRDRGEQPPRCHDGVIRSAIPGSIPAEAAKNEIFDGATPFYTYVRGVIIDGDGGVLLTGRDDSALIIEG
jgi:hypothetical protein